MINFWFQAKILMMLEITASQFNLQFILFCVLFCLVVSLCSCQEIDTNNTIISSLRDPNTITSSHNVFELGFFSPPNTTNRYLAIYYTFSPETVIWIANRETPINDSSGYLTVAPDGNLFLTNRWNETVWSTNINATSLRNNTSAQLQDTGNLLLKHSSTGTILWESFSHPVNVKVPLMKITYNTKTHANISLSSWKSPSDPAVGKCTHGLEALPLPQSCIRVNGRPFWRSGPWNGHIYSGIQIMYDLYSKGLREQGDQPPLDRQGAAAPQVYEQNGTFYTAVPAKGQFFAKTVLNSTCHTNFSFWNNQKRDWDALWTFPHDECDAYGTCGPFGSCNQLASPICSCLKGFEPSNLEEWNRGNWAGGCVRRRKLQCGLSKNTHETEDRFFRLPYTKVPDFAVNVPSIQPDECQRRCFGNCSCIAYAHEPYIGCMLWSDNLIDVMMMDGVGIDLYIRLSASEFGKPQDMMRLVITIPVVGGFVVLCISILIAWCWIVKRNGRKARVREQLALPLDFTTMKLKDERENANVEELQLFTFETLAIATNQFDDSYLLGRGGFGPVYKGILQNGKEIAVKRLSAASGQGNEEFLNEMVVISKLQHRNLVMLLGCCAEKEEKMLVYEYMPNKSLDIYLFDATVSHKILDWKRRATIIGGIGRGLLYLHSDSRFKIIHRDLKPSNVLLDEEWNPKISDFGMARIFGREDEHDNTTTVVGTYGYMAPEYAMEGQYSEKSDIYSFGVLMLEILTGKKNTHYYNQVLSSCLLGCAWKMWHENNALALADQSILSPTIQADVVRCIHIALLCVQEFPNDRPSTETVLSMISNEIIDLPIPKEPAVFLESPQAGTTHGFSRLEHSVNELTITIMDGR